MTPKNKAGYTQDYFPVPSSTMESSLSEESSYQKFIEYMPTAVAMLDRQMRYIIVSKRWQTDFSPENINIAGCSHNELFLNLPEIWHQNVQHCLAGNLEQWELEFPVTFLENSSSWIKFNVQPWLTDEGSIGGLIVHADEIRKQQELKQAQLALHQTGDAVFCMTSQGKVCYVNPATCDLLGYTETELLQLKAHEIDPDLCGVIWQEHYAQVQNQGHLRFQSSHQKKDGNIVPVEVSASYLETQPTVDNEIIENLDSSLLCWIVRDIFNHREAHSAMSASRDQLEAVLNAVPGLVSWISSDLRYLGVNKHLAQAYNVPAEEFMGKEVGFLSNTPKFNQFVYEFFDSHNWIDSKEIVTDVRGVP
ncbi:MAG: PAS domain-containing protein, partial [Cyanobacteriota bacterium]|nr:PAS domain-containing protein [Cyanobacteriota bacterium]